MISHVEAMKERIPVQIKVRKMNGLGYSQLELPRDNGRVSREVKRCAALTSGEPLSAGSTRIEAGLLAWKALPAVNRKSAAKACVLPFSSKT